MSWEDKEQDLERAVRDVYRHTLFPLRCEFKKLTYLASLRPVGAKVYRHDGLVMRYGVELANQALERCHWEVFQDLARKPLEVQHHDLEQCFLGEEEEIKSLVEHWAEQQSYRQLVPDLATPLMKEVFLVNCEILLALIVKQVMMTGANETQL